MYGRHAVTQATMLSRGQAADIHGAGSNIYPSKVHLPKQAAEKDFQIILTSPSAPAA